MKQCPYCGIDVEDGALDCIFCGHDWRPAVDLVKTDKQSQWTTRLGWWIVAIVLFVVLLLVYAKLLERVMH